MKSELVDLLCPNFYKFITLPEPQADPVPGQLIWAHTVYPPNDPLIVKVLSYNAADPGRSRYEVKKYAEGDRSHFPIPEAQLTFDENYYIYVGKERPLLVVGKVSVTYCLCLPGASSGKAFQPRAKRHAFVFAFLDSGREAHPDILENGAKVCVRMKNLAIAQMPQDRVALLSLVPRGVHAWDDVSMFLS